MISIIYEDNHVIVVEKPVNIPVQEDSTGDKDMLTLIKEDIKVRYQKPGNVYLGLVHRLDRPVGGVMVFAKTSKAASRLSDAMRRQAFDKKYLAVVRGRPKQSSARLEHYLWKDKQKNQVFAVKEGVPEAKKAVLSYEVLASANNLTLVEVELFTGRSHQIRVQLAEIGTPIYGDQKYGSKVNKPGEQIALWSHELAFEHPVKKETMAHESLPPNKYPWDLFTGNIR